MEIEKVLSISFSVGFFSLYFWYKGIKGLVQGRMKVRNPLAKSIPLTPMDWIYNKLQDSAQEYYKTPEAAIDRSQFIEITGIYLYVRSLFNIVMGLVALGVLLIGVRPDLLEIVMDWLITL